MKVFHCDHCGQLVFFENTSCLRCGHALAYIPDLADMCSLDRTSDGLWTVVRKSDNRDLGRWRLCSNYSVENVCNWAVSETDPNPLCICCRLTRVIPNLTLAGHREAWAKLETAKRRLIYTLLDLQLPFRPKQDDPDSGLQFDFLADDTQAGRTVLSGHAEGVITINVAEADDAERERRRNLLHEPYRTLLGHFRHEIGHYYWDRLIRDTELLAGFRQLFGDESADYPAALQKHYENGPPDDWQQHFISAYASAHPWEDWAETWAHYLHMVDVLQMAAQSGLTLRPLDVDAPALPRRILVQGEAGKFDQMIEGWFPITYLINNLNRGLGLADGYPFVLSNEVIAKLRFIHETVASRREVADKPEAR